MTLVQGSYVLEIRLLISGIHQDYTAFSKLFMYDLHKLIWPCCCTEIIFNLTHIKEHFEHFDTNYLTKFSYCWLPTPVSAKTLTV